MTDDVERQLAMGFDIEWYSPGVLKPPMARTYLEVEAWRAARVAEGALVLTFDEWKELRAHDH